jgi:hypothetical protein
MTCSQSCFVEAIVAHGTQGSHSGDTYSVHSTLGIPVQAASQASAAGTAKASGTPNAGARACYTASIACLRRCLLGAYSSAMTCIVLKQSQDRLFCAHDRPARPAAGGRL